MATTWNLQYDGGDILSLEDHGVSGVSRQLASQAADKVTFRTIEKAGDDPKYEHFKEIKIIRDDDGVQTTWFKGWVEFSEEYMEGSREGRSYTVSGPWMWLERLVFQRRWYWAVDPASASSSILGGYRSYYTLNADYYGAIYGQQLSTNEQIEEIVDYVNTINTAHNRVPGGDILQFGACPVVLPPFGDHKDITCAEAIRAQMRWMPNAVTRFDYSVDPPRLDVIVPDVNTPYAVYMQDNVIGQVSLKPRYDRQVPRVRIRYEIENTVDSKRWNYELWDVYPTTGPGGGGGGFLGPSVDGYWLYQDGTEIQKSLTSPGLSPTAPTPENKFNELLVSISLSGWSASFARAALSTRQWGTNDWLARKLPFLQDPNATLNSWNLKRIIYPDGSFYDPVSAPLPTPALGYDLEDGAIMDGLRFANGNFVNFQQYTALVRVNHTRAFGDLKTAAEDDLQTIRFNATNAPSGYYSGLTSFVEGDPYQVGLAQTLYEHLNILQHDGTVRIKRPELDTALLLGRALDIRGDGSNSRWNSMTIQTVQETIDNAEVTLRVGVPPHLSAGDMVELLRVSRLRWRIIPTTLPNEGATPASAQSSIRQTSKENSVPAPFMGSASGLVSRAANVNTGNLPADRVEVQQDAKKGQWKAKAHGAAEDGVAEDSEIDINLQDAQDSENNGKVIKLRELDYCDENGEAKKILIVASEPYDPPAP